MDNIAKLSSLISRGGVVFFGGAGGYRPPLRRIQLIQVIDRIGKDKYIISCPVKFQSREISLIRGRIPVCPSRRDEHGRPDLIILVHIAYNERDKAIRRRITVLPFSPYRCFLSDQNDLLLSWVSCRNPSPDTKRTECFRQSRQKLSVRQKACLRL